MDLLPDSPSQALTLSAGWIGDATVIAWQNGQTIFAQSLHLSAPEITPRSLTFNAVPNQPVTLFFHGPTSVQITLSEPWSTNLPSWLLPALIGVMLSLWLWQQLTGITLADKMAVSHSLTQLPLYWLALLESSHHISSTSLWLILYAVLLTQKQSLESLKRSVVSKATCISIGLLIFICPLWLLNSLMPPMLLALTLWQLFGTIKPKPRMANYFKYCEIAKLVSICIVLVSSIEAWPSQESLTLAAAFAWSMIHGSLLLTILVKQRRQLRQLLKVSHQQHHYLLHQHTKGYQQRLKTLTDAHHSLELKSTTDALTGMKNRGYFDEHYDIELKRGKRERQPFSLLLIDLDHFKQVNDNFGHACGDQVLSEISQICIKSLNRPSDRICRYGGEEFAVLLPNTPLEGALHVASQLQQAIKSHCILWKEHKLRVTASMGVATLLPDDSQLPSLLERADKALYKAKTGGRDRLELYPEHQNANALSEVG